MIGNNQPGSGSGAHPVDSVNGETGVVLLDTDDISEGVNKYNQTHSGDVAGATILTIQDEAVTLAKMAHMQSSSMLGRLTAGVGDVEELTPAQIRTILNVEDGAQVNTVDSVAGKTGVVTLDLDDIAETVTKKILTAIERGLIASAEQSANKNVNNGYAPLDGSALVPTANLPASVQNGTYLGSWNALTNTPTIADSDVGVANGDNYLVSVTGSQDLGHGLVTYNAGDEVKFNGAIPQWDEFGRADNVQSVAGKQGVVTLDASDITDFDVEVANNTAVSANTAKNTNVTTNLTVGNKTGTTLEVQSSDGTNATIPQAISAGDAGLMSGTDKQNVDTNTGKVSNATHTGDVTGATALTIAEEAVTLAKMAHVTQNQILGRITASTGDVEVLTPANVRTIINVEDGATADQTNSEIETAYNSQVAVVSQAEAEAGTSTTVRRWTAQRVGQAIVALASRIIASVYTPGTTIEPTTSATTSGTAPVLAQMTHTWTPNSANSKAEMFFSGEFMNDDKKNDRGARCAIFLDSVLQVQTERGSFVAKDDEYHCEMSTFIQVEGLTLVPHTLDVRFWGTDDDTIGVSNHRAIRFKEFEQ